MVKAPRDIAKEAAGLLKDYQVKLGGIDAQREALLKSTVRKAEEQKIGVVRSLVQRLFNK